MDTTKSWKSVKKNSWVSKKTFARDVAESHMEKSNNCLAKVGVLNSESIITSKKENFVIESREK